MTSKTWQTCMSTGAKSEKKMKMESSVCRYSRLNRGEKGGWRVNLASWYVHRCQELDGGEVEVEVEVEGEVGR